MVSDGKLVLENGSSVAVVGGGPAGSFFAYFAKMFAERLGTDIRVDIYEPRDFWSPGPIGCNMCGGIISESLVQNLALEGIDLPESMVQRGIDSYVLHMPEGSCHIATPLQEKRIAAVHRGGGPRTVVESKWDSFDAFLLKLAIEKGANFYNARVKEIGWSDGRPEVQAADEKPKPYDLLVGATGVNSPDLKLFEALGFNYSRPQVVKTYITELEFGSELVKKHFGSSMHVFLLNLPRLDFAALIPKGDFVTLCMLGRNIDKELISSFMEHPQVRRRFPPDWVQPANYCRCGPKMYFGEARQVFADRVVLVGDSGVSRLFKDGIGAAYKTAKAAARTAVFEGISAAAFRDHYFKECLLLNRDNRFGRAVFSVVHLIKHMKITSNSVLRVVEKEQDLPGEQRHMSMVLWDTFTGSAPYKSIFARSMKPAFLGRLALAHLGAYRRTSADGTDNTVAGRQAGG